VYERRNQWWNPLKARTGSNLVDRGRAAVHIHTVRYGDSEASEEGWWGGHEESLRRTRGETAGEKLDTAPVNRSVVNVGTILKSPSRMVIPTSDGQARRQPMASGWGGALAVVRGRESRPHGEGGQQVRSRGTGISEGRR